MRKVVTSGELLETLLLDVRVNSSFSAWNTGRFPAGSFWCILPRTTDPASERKYNS